MSEQCEFIGDCGACGYQCKLDCDTFIRKFLTDNQPTMADFINAFHELRKSNEDLAKEVKALTVEIRNFKKEKKVS